jgi:pimeloyl-ACP methyl ester carboxylesterase
MELSGQTITLRGGRVLGYDEYGDPNGKSLFFFHGWPSSRLAAGKFEAIAQALHIRIIAPDRPGFGMSDFKKDRTILDWPDDVTALADALKIRKFAVMGVSGGGPYAAVCAYKIPQRITRVGIVAGLAPLFDWKSLDGITWLSKIGWATFGKHPNIRKFSAIMEFLYIRYFPSQTFHHRFFGAKSDRAICRNTKVGQAVTINYREAFRQGYRGPELDLKLFTTDWGFDVSDIRLKTFLWYGACDQNVSQAMGRYYHSNIRGSTLTMFPGEGHLIADVHAPEILKTLIQ